MDIASIVIAFISGFIIAWTLRRPKAMQRTIHQPKKPEPQYNVAANRARQETKENRKQQIIDCIDMNGQITSREVEQMFGVSSATATRYLGELNKESRVKKHGQGRGVHYTF